MNNSTNLNQIKGGRIVASGDVASVFSYELQDENFIKVNSSGDATLSLINRTDGNMYLNEIKQVTNGVITFTLPLLKNDSYSVSIKFNGSTYPSDDSVYIIILKNPDDAILNTVDPVTIDTYLAEYAKKTELPDTSLLALKSEVPSTVGLATELYVDEHIAAIPSVDLTGLATEDYVVGHIADSIGAITVDTTGLATETYVQEQISTIPIQEPIDTSIFLTKPLAEPTLMTDPATKNYVDNALETVVISGEEWTIISQGTTVRVALLLRDWMYGNQFKKVKLYYTFNTGPASSSYYWNNVGSATSFDAHFNFTYGAASGQSSVYPLYNQTSDVPTKLVYNPGDKPVTYNAGNALFEIDFQKVSSLYNLNIQSINNACKLNIKVNTDNFAIPLDSVSTNPLYNFKPNYDTFFTLDVNSNKLYFLIDNIIGANAADTKVFWTILGSNS